MNASAWEVKGWGAAFLVLFGGRIVEFQGFEDEKLVSRRRPRLLLLLGGHVVIGICGVQDEELEILLGEARHFDGYVLRPAQVEADDIREGSGRKLGRRALVEILP